MSFHSPAALLALAAVPLLVWVYVDRRRAQSAAERAFASPHLAPSHTPRPPGARRHIPFVAYAVALVALLLAVARPQHSVAVPVERASIMLVTDTSGSMLAKDVAPNRLSAARDAAKAFVDRVPGRVNIGVMTFNQVASVLAVPTREKAEVRAALDRMQAGGGTATGSAVATATRILRPAGQAPGQSRPPAAIVLLSDGASTKGVDPVAAARAAKRQGVRVYTVALGTANGTITVPRSNGTPQTKAVPPDPTTLKAMARAGGGAFFQSASADGLNQVYQRLGSQLGHRKVQREVTPAFAAGAFLLLLTGAGLSLRWFGRLI